jgi:Asp-tRNA(Asn)/Glu-tRNA(Gln) amidotransferase A subunit family amidase
MAVGRRQVAMQMVAERHQDALLLQLAWQYERAHDAHALWPAFPFTRSPNRRASARL